jgi:regulator of protease activity HflC (stomatin/prohibitin superfamily)
MQALASEGKPDQPVADGLSSAAVTSTPQRISNAISALKLFVVVLSLMLITRFFIVVPAGERGVLTQFGAVQNRILEEGLHPLIPLVQSVNLLSVRVQSYLMQTDAASRDLQDVAAKVALNWHVLPDQVNALFQRLGDLDQIAGTVVRPALEDSIKTVIASYTAEQLVTERSAVKVAIANLVNTRLSRYSLVLDDIDLLQVSFSERFREAVEAKQVAEQEVKRAEYETIRAQRMADAKVFLAKGQAQAQQLLQAGLTPEILEHEAIEKWNGHLPLVIGNDAVGRFDFKSLVKADRKQKR